MSYGSRHDNVTEQLRVLAANWWHEAAVLCLAVVGG